MKFNLNQKREWMLKVIEVEQNKRRKVGEALKGTYDGLSVKKKQLVETQYQVSKMELKLQGPT